MSSVEIVDVINQLRPAGSAELAHSDFIKKIERHPGIAHPNFRGSYFDSTGREVKCYYLPKREAELMVMSRNRCPEFNAYRWPTDLYITS